MVAPLSASGRAANTASIAPGPTSFSRATAFCVSELVGSGEDRISVTSRSARKFVKKLIQPLRLGSSPYGSSAADAGDHGLSSNIKERAHRTSVNYAIALSTARRDLCAHHPLRPLQLTTFHHLFGWLTAFKHDPK